MALIYVLLGLLAVCWCLLSFRKKGKGKVIPGPVGLPVVGNGFDIDSSTLHLTLTKYAEQFGDIVKLKVFKDTLISLNSADLIRTAFNNEPYKKFMNDRPFTFWGNYVLNESQSIGFYPKAFRGVHGELRKGLTKAFHVYGDGIKEFEDLITKELRRLHKTIEAKEGQDFELIAVMKRSLSNVLSCLLSGEELLDDDEDVDVFWKLDYANDYLLNAGTNSILLTFPFLVKLPCYYKQIYDEGLDAKRIIVDRYFTKVKNTHIPGIHRGIVDFFLDEQARDIEAGREVVFTDERIINTVLETVAVGILTTLSGISNTILCLMDNPEYQERVHKELDSVLGPTRMPSLDDRGNCPFLEAIVTESTRYIPVSPLMLPHACAPETEFEGYNIPAGSLLIPNVWYIHHNPTIWGDPWTFRPERWLDDHGQILSSTHPIRKHLLSFGTGRRQCIGEQFARSRLFLYLASLLKTFTFTPTPGKCGSCDPREGSYEISSIVRPKPYYCTAKKRI